MSESRGVVLGWECHPVFCHRRHRALIWLMSFPAAIGRLLTFCHHLKHLRRIRPANSLHFNWRGVYKTLRMGRARGLRKNNSDPQRRVINNVSGQEGATITEHGLRILALLARKRKESKLRELWWRCPGLNGGPAAYESAALPTELHRQAEDEPCFIAWQHKALQTPGQSLASPGLGSVFSFRYDKRSGITYNTEVAWSH
jgi:hypothetical protein